MARFTDLAPDQLGDIGRVLVEVNGDRFRAYVSFPQTDDGLCDGEGAGPTIETAIAAAFADLVDED